MDDATPISADRQKFYNRISPSSMAPLWEVLKGLVPEQPKSKFAPHVWKYADAKPLLLEAGKLLTAEEAERRVLLLENPAAPGASRITATMFAGYQLIMPGEIAPAHRHTASALRMVLEGNGGYTAVAGEKTTMQRGDLVITPSMAWHDHGQEDQKPCIWVDGLDIHMVNFHEAAFSDHFNYSYAKTRPALMQVAATDAPDAHLGNALRYVNPQDGGWAMPTIATWMTYLPKGFETRPMRSTDGQGLIVVEGEITFELDGKTHVAGESDVVAIPSWTNKKMRASKDAVVFTMSDRAAQEKLGFYREERK